MSLKRAIRTVNTIFSIVLLITIAHELPNVRGIIKQILAWPQHVFGLFDYVSEIAKAHAQIDLVCAIVLSACILARVSLSIILICNTCKSNKSKGDNAFESSLLRYLNQSDSGRCYLLSGHWGVGKSYLLEKCLEKYYHGTNRRVYKVSCFGLTTRKDIIDELNMIIAAEDYSFNSVIAKVLGFIPVVGDFLENLFKKSYGYGNVKNQSIFVFEDFERLAAKPNRDRRNGNHGSERATMLVNNEGDKIVAFEVRNATQEISGLNDAIYAQIEKIDLDKYLAIIGVINEIVDQRKCKAIIVCNTDMVGEQFVSDILRKKLNCYEYRKNVDDIARKQLVKRISENIEIEDRQKNKIIKEYISNVDLIAAQRSIGDTNLRLLANVIEAFIVTAELFEESSLKTEGFLDSLYISILVVNASKAKGMLAYLRKKPTGLDMRLIYKGGEVKYTKPYKWVDYRVSAYYFANLAKPTDCETIVEEWKNYKYSDIERCILNREYDAFEYCEYNVFHLALLIQDAENNPDIVATDWHKYVDKTIDTMAQDVNDGVKIFLDGLSENLTYYSSRVDDELFEIVSRKTGNTPCDGDSRYVIMYNEYLKEHLN